MVASVLCAVARVLCVVARVLWEVASVLCVVASVLCAVARVLCVVVRVLCAVARVLWEVASVLCVVVRVLCAVARRLLTVFRVSSGGLKRWFCRERVPRWRCCSTGAPQTAVLEIWWRFCSVTSCSPPSASCCQITAAASPLQVLSSAPLHLFYHWSKIHYTQSEVKY